MPGKSEKQGLKKAGKGKQGQITQRFTNERGREREMGRETDREFELMLPLYTEGSAKGFEQKVTWRTFLIQ